MREQDAIDRILETENLTYGLEDDDANWLLDWGIKLLPEVIGGVADDEVAGDKVNGLMAVMRKINQITADRADKDPEELSEDIHSLAGHSTRAFGIARSTNPDQELILAQQIAGLSSRETIQILLDWIKAGPE
jgi:hypothetical protein